MIKFRTFKPFTEYDNQHRQVVYSATLQVNEWLEDNPDVEIVSWQTTAVGKEHELYITIQYKENQ
jgi:O-acetylhomoserine/O-acetylserine sulfhydrylase-like pyridoxal-dependent enzyme